MVRGPKHGFSVERQETTVTEVINLKSRKFPLVKFDKPRPFLMIYGKPFIMRLVPDR